MYKQYVVVRKDLPKIHYVIQSSHAAAFAAENTPYYDRYPPTPDKRHMIVLQVSNKFKLRLVSWYLKFCCGIVVHEYYEEYEPVSEWGMTAISFYAIDRSPVPFLKLLELN